MRDPSGIRVSLGFWVGFERGSAPFHPIRIVFNSVVWGLFGELMASSASNGTAAAHKESRARCFIPSRGGFYQGLDFKLSGVEESHVIKDILA